MHDVLPLHGTVMALLVFGPPEVRRAYVGVMRLVATAGGTRPFDGDSAALVRMFAGLQGCAGCHGFDKSLDFSALLGSEEPWVDEEEAIASIAQGLSTEKDRQEAVHAGLMVSLYSHEPDPAGTRMARRVAVRLGADDALFSAVEKIANENVATAKAEVFRRMLSGRTGIGSELIAAHMSAHSLGQMSPPELVARYHRLLADAPAGSLGAEMLQFYKDADFDIPGTPGVPLPVEFLGSHDVHHVLAGYGASPQGEVYTAVFNAANSSAGIGWLSVVLLQWHQGVKMGVFAPVHSHLDPQLMGVAAQRGAQTPVDVYDSAWDWLPLLSLPLGQVRQQLGIPPGGTVGPGVSWSS